MQENGALGMPASSDFFNSNAIYQQLSSSRRVVPSALLRHAGQPGNRYVWCAIEP
jgi:hypothetical protein